jgi:hypothetical protein
MYRPVYEGIDFLIGKNKTFISWICPLLHSRAMSPQETVYYEGDKINNIYFMYRGTCSYVLRSYQN